MASTTHPTLLREIQEAATSAATPLPEALRKAQILAARLNHQPLKDWVNWELNGYPDVESVPDYRRMGEVQVLGDFSGPFGSALKNARIPPGCVADKDMRDYLFRHVFLQRVAELEALASAPPDTLYVPWPSNVVASLGQNIYEDMVCLSANKIFSTAVVAGILDAVRNKLLAFALEIEAANPDAGEAEPGDVPVPPERVTQIVNTTIYGGQNTIAAGNRDVLQRPTHVKLAGGFDELRKQLADLGLGGQDLNDLEAALGQDVGHAAPGTLGPATQNWLGGITSKVASGSLALASGVTVETVAHLVCKALGIA